MKVSGDVSLVAACPEGTRESVSSEEQGRRAVTTTGTHHGQAAPGSSDVDAPAEVLEFIRYCYRRRGYGWPELYDEMCGAAARGSYRGMDYEQLDRLGIRFSLGELPRLAALSEQVVAEERLARRGRASDAAMPKGRRDEVEVAGVAAAT